MIYQQGQVANIGPWLGPWMEWFILGGPADGDEAQLLHSFYPNTKIIGVEPNPTFYTLQLGRGFPGQLIDRALDNIAIPMRFPTNGIDGERCASLVHCQPGWDYRECHTVTLDWLSDHYGPFDQSVLWLDIEGAELRALIGAQKLLRRDMVRVINVEILLENDMVRPFLLQWGFEEVHRWGLGVEVENVVFIKR